MANYSAENPETDILFIYGTECDEVSVTFYNKTGTGEICVGWDTGCSYQSQTAPVKLYPTECNEGENITVNLGDKPPLTFKLTIPGENFFIVLRKEIGEETIVAQQE